MKDMKLVKKIKTPHTYGGAKLKRQWPVFFDSIIGFFQTFFQLSLVSPIIIHGSCKIMELLVIKIDYLLRKYQWRSNEPSGKNE